MSELSQEIVDLLSVSVIASAFYIQGQAYYKPLVRAIGVQSFALAVLSAYLGLTMRVYDYFILAIVLILLRGVVTPYVLLKALGNRYGERERIRGVASLLMVDLGLFFIAVLVLYELVVPMVFSGDVYELVFPLSLLFQGLFLMASRNSTPAQIVGYVEEENAIVMLGAFLVPIPLLIEVSVFLDVLGIVAISSLVVLEKREHKPMEELKG
ncbi:MAG: hydrogenase [Candidatus Aramenus sp.]|nr:hydrogenase [Candidatus Aramenus sp.]